jgi:hypothetical protein
MTISATSTVPEQVDATTAQPSQLPDAQPAVRGDQD